MSREHRENETESVATAALVLAFGPLYRIEHYR
jgi:hypothetical protein